jgi:hypothetical protein
MSKKSTNENQAREGQADPVPAGEAVPAADAVPENGAPPGDSVPSGGGNPEGQGDSGNQGKPEGQSDSGGGGNPDGQNDPGSTGTPGLFTIEDHAKERKTPASVFAAVTQMRGWAAGKKVTAEEYGEAVDAFTGAPMGGERAGDKSPEGEKR